MLRRRPVLRNAGAVLFLCLGLTTAGCSPGPVEFDPPAVRGTDASACRRLVDALPSSVSEQQRRDVEPEEGYGAAWGDPAIVLRCGVGRPAGFDDFSTCQVTDGVGWFIPERQITGQAVDVLMTTVDREPAVEVRIPADYFPPAATMVDLAPAITASSEQEDPCL